MDVRHQAIEGKTGIYYHPYYRDLRAAKAMGKSEDEWWQIPYSARVTAVAQYEAEWRIEALQAWEQQKKKK